MNITDKIVTEHVLSGYNQSQPDGMLALSIAVKENKFPHTMDAKIWVKEWMEHIDKNPSIATDEGAMLGWFVNAIMAGYDQAQINNQEK